VKIGQQSNFNSLIQSIGLRSNVEWNRDPEMKDGRLSGPFQGKSNHWIWEFEVERERVFEQDNDPVALLKEDLNGVPVVVGLRETAEIRPAVFQTKGEFQNTLIEII
jgi:hypothetical protein